MNLKKIVIPEDYDYVGVYLTQACHLKCSYCITHHHGASYRQLGFNLLSPQDWVTAINRLVLPKDTPISFQGGEPFLYKGIDFILENSIHKIDIMTAFPPNITRDFFLKLKTLDWNKRNAPYPTIRVSYHPEQHDYKELIEQIAAVQDLVSIGLYYIGDPITTEEESIKIKLYAKKYGVELRLKEFLGEYQGKSYGHFLYRGSVDGKRHGVTVFCKNTVVPIAPDGTIYRCHSDLYFQRKELALGNVLDEEFIFSKEHIKCSNYGLCSECDVKVKTNRYQKFGYTSVHILKEDGMEMEKAYGEQCE